MKIFPHIKISRSQVEYNILTNNQKYPPYKTKDICNISVVLCFYCDKRAAPSWDSEAYICTICKKELCKSCVKKHNGADCFARFLAE